MKLLLIPLLSWIHRHSWWKKKNYTYRKKIQSLKEREIPRCQKWRGNSKLERWAHNQRNWLSQMYFTRKIGIFIAKFQVSLFHFSLPQRQPMLLTLCESFQRYFVHLNKCIYTVILMWIVENYICFSHLDLFHVNTGTPEILWVWFQTAIKWLLQ